MDHDRVEAILGSPVNDGAAVGEIAIGIQLETVINLLGTPEVDGTVVGERVSIKRWHNGAVIYQIYESIEMIAEPESHVIRSIILSNQYRGEFSAGLRLGVSFGELKRSLPDLEFSFEENFIGNNKGKIVFIADRDLCFEPEEAVDRCTIVAVQLMDSQFPDFTLASAQGL